jgi:hypothetical protein
MHCLVSLFPLAVEIIPPTTSGDRWLGLVCLLMFFAGIWLAFHKKEVKFAPPSVNEDRPTQVSTHEDKAA